MTRAEGMRIPLAVVGALSLVGYAVFGAVLMNDWAMTAASHLPLDRTVAAMRAADQPVGSAPGLLFAATGSALAITWAMLLLVFRRVPIWCWCTIWAGLLLLGAPAYFVLSFGNMMSVGDTFADWDSEAAAALELPLYAVSGFAGLLAISITVLAALRRRPGITAVRTERA